MGGVLVENFENTGPQRYQVPFFFLAWLEFFSVLRITNSKTAHYLVEYFYFGPIP